MGDTPLGLQAMLGLLDECTLTPHVLGPLL